MSQKPELKIGLALGSGSARGMSHIGILNELAEHGVVPDVICGTSIGAMVAAAWITGQLESLEAWALQMTKFKAVRFLDFDAHLTSFIDLSRFGHFLDEHVADESIMIEDCHTTFGAISTELETAREKWMTRGSLKEAVWASMAFPGLFPPRHYDGQWLIDGGLVNPVPVSLCHALGANFTIAVNLNGDLVDKHFESLQRDAIDEPEPSTPTGLTGRLSRLVQGVFPGSGEGDTEERPPGVIHTFASAINITQDRITRSRMAGDPPDVLLSPRLGHIGLLELYRAEEAIEEGRHCVRRMLPEIERVVQVASNQSSIATLPPVAFDEVSGDF